MKNFKFFSLLLAATVVLNLIVTCGLKDKDCSRCAQLEVDVKELTTAVSTAHSNIQDLFEIVKEHVLDKEKHN